MAQKKIKKNIKFEEALSELEKIVNKLENEEISLEESIDSFKNGIEFASFCASKLKEAEQEIKKIVESNNGAFTLEPLNFDGE